MERRFRGIISAAVLRAKRESRGLELARFVRGIEAATPLDVSRSELSAWAESEAERQGVPLLVSGLPEDKEGLSDQEILSVGRMAHESGEFYRGLLEAIGPKLN